MRRFFVLSAVAGMGLLCLVSEGKADFRVCNKSEEAVNVSIGYKADPYGWTAEGWWKIAKGDCKVLTEGDLANRYYYVYGVGEDGGTWSGGKKQEGGNFCVATQKYTIHNRDYQTGDTLDCKTGGFKTVKFSEIDTEDNDDFTYNLTE